MSEIVQPVYDQTKPYTWKPEDVFSFTGGEFGFLFNSIVKREAEVLAELERINIMKTKLKESVEAGVAQEKTD